MQLLRQTTDSPLFSDLLWSRPENKLHAGKLLIIGGNLHGFSAPAEAYNQAESSGIGVARVLLPDKIKKIVGPFFETAEFCPSTPSGSFSQKALAPMLDNALWADGVLFSGDLGRNSETAIVFEKFLQKNTLPIVITKDAVDYYIQCAAGLESKNNHTLVLTIAQLQKLAISLKFPRAFTFDMTLPMLTDTLQEFTEVYGFAVMTKFHKQIIVASDSHVATHTLSVDKDIWRATTASSASVWWLQNPTKRFESLVTSTL